jgi:hypothetical protein
LYGEGEIIGGVFSVGGEGVEEEKDSEEETLPI